ncbi:uncharacterized protein RCC_05019 [Ramularia collo-cygni]|uniref:2EXR domain-containing protein n=1 Tax=Ramularia collo-cygni TaxID=112498 RepID=A0A2D3VEX3_9PEZI|nr:uncharacterized protein RCC_05019 [Ramularia collo-cygni]CZT19173.1 uncharacterized protein RCC_05019 [Ramularia collo-cygni]
MEDSLFGKFPAEIRAQVWTLTLQQETPIEVDECGHRMRSYSKIKPNLLALLRTCKSINNECKSMFYALNHFTLQTHRSVAIRLSVQRLVESIGPENARLVKTLHIHSSVDVDNTFYTTEYLEQHLVEAEKWFNEATSSFHLPYDWGELKVTAGIEANPFVWRTFHIDAWIRARRMPDGGCRFDACWSTEALLQIVLKTMRGRLSEANYATTLSHGDICNGIIALCFVQRTSSFSSTTIDSS